MLGTHSEPRRGQMSHTCDISSLRVNLIDDFASYYYQFKHYFCQTFGGRQLAPGDPQALAKGAYLCLQDCCRGIANLEMIINGT